MMPGWLHLRRLLGDRGGAAAVVVAVALPALLVGMALAVETAFVEVRQSQLQAVADAAAGGAREKLDPFAPTPLPDGQSEPRDEAVRLAAANDMPAAVAGDDVKEGWWNVWNTTPGADKFGPPIVGQTGALFSNAVRVTAREDHVVALGALLGRDRVALGARATAYKCSNLDYPLTRIADDPTPPPLPQFWASWATPGHDADTSYYYQQANGARNPVYKFWAPNDNEDVSYVLFFSNGYKLQVDTYCRGTYLVSPAEFDSRKFVDGNRKPVTITATIKRGSTNNSFDLYPDQSKYKWQADPTPYNTANEVPTPQYDLNKVHTTHYPNATGHDQDWASEGNPTPDRRTLLVR